MKISFVSSLKEPNLSSKNYSNKKLFGIPKMKELSTDTFSTSQDSKANNITFRSAPTQTATVSLLDFIAEGVNKNQKRYGRIAMTFLDVLESTANKLKEFGVSFDREYCEKNPVKSTESYISKIIRSKSLKVPDTIRATLYVKNPYDLDTLNKIFTEMKKRGYVVAKTEKSIHKLTEHGYIPTKEEMTNLDKEILVPDLDIRLDHVDDITKLPQEYLYSLSSPQKSGYEDIQVRFVREFVKENKNNPPIQHELIVLFGPETAKTKHLESNYIYNNLRKFNELNIKLDKSEIGSNSHKAARYIDLIRQMITGKISQKLYINAKNSDVYDLNEKLLIEFDELDINALNGYFAGLNDRLKNCYLELKNEIKSVEEKKLLQKNYRHDKNIINEIHTKILEAIDFFTKNELIENS